MAKICKANGCNNLVYSNLYCRIHQWMRTDDKYKRYKENKKQGRIPKKSERRKRDEVHYKDHCIELTRELKEKNGGKLFCFFSGLEIVGRATYHHLRGRTGDFYTDKEWLVPCLNDYHLMYHFKPVEFLLTQDWYNNVFIPNIRAKAEDLYQKELNKVAKAEQDRQRELFDNED